MAELGIMQNVLRLPLVPVSEELQKKLQHRIEQIRSSANA